MWEYILKFELSLLCSIVLFIENCSAEGYCTKWEYNPEANFTTVLQKFCCPGYREVSGNRCLPICDMGCPSNSHCIMPRVCGCNAGYNVNETQLEFGTEILKSCIRSDALIFAISAVAVALLLLTIIIIIVIYVCHKRRAQAKTVHCYELEPSDTI